MHLRWPQTSSEWIRAGVTAATSLLFGLVILNLETFAQSKGWDRLWAAKVSDTTFHWLLFLFGISLGAAISIWGDWWLRRKEKSAAHSPNDGSDLAEITIQFVPNAAPVELNNINVYSWDGVTMALETHSQDGNRSRISLTTWVLALWFDEPINGYQVTAVNLSGSLPLWEARQQSPRGVHLLVDMTDTAFVTRFRFERRQ